MIWRENDVIAAMLYMILYANGVYLYALGTLPEYRSRGIMPALIDNACDLCKNIGAKGIFLVPSDITMDKYYGRFGFVKSDCNQLLRTNLLNDYEQRIRQYVEFIELYENDNMKFIPEYFLVKNLNGFDIRDICGYIPF